jgi:hypothetical protein
MSMVFAKAKSDRHFVRGRVCIDSFETIDPYSYHNCRSELDRDADLQESVHIVSHSTRKLRKLGIATFL